MNRKIAPLPDRSAPRPDPAGDRAPRIVKLIDLSSDDPVGPLHLRLARRIRSLIAEGHIAPGAKLPASRLLARGLGVSRNSVIAAIDLLVADGLLETRRGSGVRVCVCAIQALAMGPTRPPAQAIEDSLEPLPFAVGSPGLDLFPLDRWAKLQARRWRSLPSSALREGHGAGWSGLREAIASHLATSRGLSCDPAQVFVTTSTGAAVDLAVRALQLQGWAAWVEDPGYSWLRGTLRSHRMTVAPIPVDQDGLCVHLGLARAPNARLAIVTPAAHFPTEVEMSDARRAALLDWSRTRDTWIIEDDYDAEFRFGGRAKRPLAATAAKGERVLYVCSFNKTLFPTLRIAWLVVPVELIDVFLRARHFVDGHSNVPNQMVLADFIEGGHLDEHLIRCRTAYGERRMTLLDGVAENLAGRMSVAPRPGGLHVVGRLESLSAREAARLAEPRRVHLPLMDDYCEVVERPAEVLLGFAGFKPPVITAALTRLADCL